MVGRCRVVDGEDACGAGAGGAIRRLFRRLIGRPFGRPIGRLLRRWDGVDLGWYCGCSGWLRGGIFVLEKGVVLEVGFGRGLLIVERKVEMRCRSDGDVKLS